MYSYLSDYAKPCGASKSTMLVYTLIYTTKFGLNAMKLSELLSDRRAQSNRTLQQIHDVTGIAM